MPSPARTPRIVLAHDWLCGYRGGEAVLDRLARLVTQRYDAAALMVMFHDRRPMPSAIDAIPKRVSRLGQLPGASGSLRRWLLPLYPAAVDSLSRSLAALHRESPIDLLISSSSAAIKGLRPPKGVPHLCYCHSPARYLWGRGADYTAGAVGGLRGAGLALFGERLRRWDRASASGVTRFIANSRFIATEIERCYGREAGVVFPPVRTDFYTPDASISREGFWLVAGALEPYKRVDLAIGAANASGHRLVIAGAGSDEKRLRAMARDNVEFVGRVSDDELRDLYRRASVLLFAHVEDFGIVAVEAQACGLPVVARAEGGTLDSVIPGQTGVYCDQATVPALLEAIRAAPRDAAAACRANAERFAETVFDAAMAAEIESALAGR